MNITGVIVVFVIVWWVVFFMMLPVGVTQEVHPQQGNDPGAPQKTDLKKKIYITTLVTLVISVGYFVLLEQGYLSFIQVR